MQWNKAYLFQKGLLQKNTNTKTKTKTKNEKDPDMCYVFREQRMQGYQI